jgi:hypothetical protein
MINNVNAPVGLLAHIIQIKMVNYTTSAVLALLCAKATCFAPTSVNTVQRESALKMSDNGDEGVLNKYSR